MPLCEVPVSVGPHQSTDTPHRGDTHGSEEGPANQASRDCAAAPALEHGHQSNQKQNDRDRRKNLGPHMTTSREWPKLPIQARMAKRTLITVLGDLVGRPLGWTSARSLRIE